METKSKICRERSNSIVEHFENGIRLTHINSEDDVKSEEGLSDKTKELSACIKY